MRHDRFLAAMIALAVGTLLAAGCSSDTSGGTDGGADGGAGGGTGGGTDGGTGGGTDGGTGGSNAGGSGGGTASLQWYASCGDPVCGPEDAGAGGSGAAACTTEKAGDACTSEGATCDAGLGCGALLICAKSDPKAGPGGCPISRARYKTDIDYVSDGQLQGLHDELMTMRLANWRYKSEPASARSHLGFLIDDNPESASVDRGGDKVDLYGYTSMAVAAAQVQNRRIEALEKELDTLRAEIASLKKR
jgi:hypothetical protein